MPFNVIEYPKVWQLSKDSTDLTNRHYRQPGHVARIGARKKRFSRISRPHA
ncbi:hypothetical protein I552_5091 [Mycobacterium xenopi 3993]|nr:hypothetical protein I552_5091 [Mycobacterium xenopi 3993]